MTDSYIKSSYGAKIDFERDSKGRIVAAIDQDGNKVLYGYDKNGDLVSFTDRESNTTRFEYNSTRKHYLDKVIDPLNRAVMRNEYDALGRLTKVFDAAGNAINMTFDPENQIQVVTDALGHSTTYEYDDRGNTLQVRNALGNVTSYTYDQNNNILSKRDPLGNTTTYTYDSNNNVIKEVDVLGYTSTISYDAAGNPTSTQDHFGNVTLQKFGGNGQIEKIIDSKGTTFSFSYDSGTNPTLMQMSGVDFAKLEYDSNGRMLRQTDAGGRSIKYTYDGSGRVIKTEQIVTDASGVQKTITELFEYNKNGNLIAFTNADGGVKRAEYDASDRLIAEVDVSGKRKEQTYDIAGNVIKLKDYDGYFETYTYDVLGRNTSITDPNGNTVYFEYDALGRTTKVILPDGTANDLSDNPSVSATYDALGNATKITYSDGSFIEREYNAIGKITKEKNHLGREIYFTYNVDGTPSTFTDVDGGVTKYVYNNFSALVETIYPDGTRVASSTNTSPIIPGQSINTTNSNGHKFTLETNLVNQLTAIVTSQGQRMEYFYNEKGNLIKQTDFNGNVTSYEYDGLGRKTARILPEGQKEEINYNQLNQVTSLKDLTGQSFSYAYDTKGRLIQSTLPDSSNVNYNYNSADNLTAITNSNGTATYEHDLQGRLIKSTDVNGRVIEYGFDSNGFRNLIKTESGSTYYNYTAEGLLISIVDSRLGTTSFSYDELGNLLTKTLPNGITETYEWQATGFLTKLIQTDSSGQVISSYRYERDGLGNVIKIHENTGLSSARTISYTYDYLNRLTNETIVSTSDGDRTILYAYDGMGNRKSRNDSMLGVTTYTYGANGQLLSETEGSLVTNYTYDANGNRILKENTNGVTLYQWNSISQLVNVTKKDGSDTVIDSITYKYDNQGNRISQIINGVETQFLLDYTQPFVQVREEYTNGVVSSAYVNDGSQSPLARLSSGQAEFYLGDRQDSTRVLANSNGELIQKYVYDSYGRILQETGNSSNSYQYAGEQYDELTGLQYLRFRYSDINSGSFISRDTYEGEITDPLSRNQYSYTKSNPSTYTDPSGHFSLSEFATSQKIQDILQAGQTAQRFVQLYQLEEKISFFVTAMWLSGVLVELFQDYIEKWPFGGAFANVFGSAGGSASGFTALVPTTFQFFKPPSGLAAKMFKKIEWGWGAGLSFDPDNGGMSSGSTYGTASGFISFEGVFGSSKNADGSSATSGAKFKVGFQLKNQLTPDFAGQLSWKPKVSLDITVGQELTLYERKFDVKNLGSLTLAKLVLGAEVKGGTSNQALLSKAAYNVYGQLSLGEAVAANGWGTTMGKYKLNLFTLEYSNDGKESGINIQLFGQPIWESPPSP
jgi:RHS repeat-associated protein